MSQSFLAFKGVNDKLRSAFISSYEIPLTIQYRVGRDIRRSPKWPMWLVDYYALENCSLGTGCDPYISRLLLVRVPCKHIVTKTIFLHNAEMKYQTWGQLKNLIGKMWENKHTTNLLGATRLTVLEEVPVTLTGCGLRSIRKFPSTNQAMNFYEEKYGLPRLTHRVAETWTKWVNKKL